MWQTESYTSATKSEPVVSRQTVSKSERPDQNRGPFATKPDIESQYYDDAALKRVLECKLFLFCAEKITHAPQIVHMPPSIYFFSSTEPRNWRERCNFKEGSRLVFSC